MAKCICGHTLKKHPGKGKCIAIRAGPGYVKWCFCQQYTEERFVEKEISLTEKGEKVAEEIIKEHPEWVEEADRELNS